MHIDVGPDELTDEVNITEKLGRNKVGEPTTFKGVRMWLYSTHRLTDMHGDAERSTITIWLPKSELRRWELVNALRSMAQLVENEIHANDDLIS